MLEGGSSRALSLWWVGQHVTSSPFLSGCHGAATMVSSKSVCNVLSQVTNDTELRAWEVGERENEMSTVWLQSLENLYPKANFPLHGALLNTDGLLMRLNLVFPPLLKETSKHSPLPSFTLQEFGVQDNNLLSMCAQLETYEE